MSTMSTETRDDPAHLIPVAGQLRASRRRWRVLAFVALAIAILALLGRFALHNTPVADHIARITIDGTIATDPDRVATFKKIGDDPTIKAVILSINSGGGTTAGGEELYESLTALRAKKPVVAVIGELGASAAYMTAIAADRIFARRLSIVGSIGVLFQHIDASKLMNLIGVSMDKVASGPLKAEPDLTGPIKPEVRASLNALISDSYNWFVDVVSERRGIPRANTLTLADGRILTGRQALDAKLIDAIGGEAEATAWLASDKKIAADLPVISEFPLQGGWGGFGKFFGSEARAALGLPADAPIALDGLVSLWQVGPS
jgi:protease-4